MDNPVDTSDLATLWRPLTPVEEGRAAALLTFTWSMLLGRSKGLSDRVDAGEVPLDNVKWVVIQTVLRVLKNPDGHRQESKTIDDYTKSWVLDRAVSTGELYISGEHLALLGEPRRRGRAFTIVTG